MFCEIEINMSHVEDETAGLGGFKIHWRSSLKTIPFWLIHHFFSWAERLNPPTNDKDKTARPWLRLCQMVGHFSRSCKGPRINGQKLNRHWKCRLESRWGAMCALFMQIYVYRKDGVWQFPRRCRMQRSSFLCLSNTQWKMRTRPGPELSPSCFQGKKPSSVLMIIIYGSQSFWSGHSGYQWSVHSCAGGLSGWCPAV